MVAPAGRGVLRRLDKGRDWRKGEKEHRRKEGKEEGSTGAQEDSGVRTARRGSRQGWRPAPPAEPVRPRLTAPRAAPPFWVALLV